MSIKIEVFLALLKSIKPEVNFEENNNLIEDEELDSFDIVAIVAALNEEYDIQIGAGDVVPENFNSVEAMYKLVQRLEEE